MAKVSTQYVCSNCGAKAPQMIGRCPVCGEWGTYEEDVETPMSAKKGGAGLRRGGRPQLLHEIDVKEDMRIDMHSTELNRVLNSKHKHHFIDHFKTSVLVVTRLINNIFSYIKT